MILGASTACLYPLETEKAIDELAKLDIKNIEIFLEANSEAELSFCKILKEKIDYYGMNVVSVHAFCAAFEPFLFSEYKRRSDDALSQYIKICRAMQYLGASYYSFHGNRNNATTDKFSYREYCLTFSSLAKIAREFGGLLAWENVSWCQSGSAKFLKNCLQYLDKNDFGFTFDFKQALRAGEEPEEYLKIMKDNLVNVHVSDYDEYSPCKLPGTGKRDFDEVVALLKKYNYDKTMLIEVYNDCYRNYNEIGKSFDYLKGLITQYERQNS